MKRAIIVHGCPSNIERAMDPKKRTYNKHWMPWLKKQLEKHKIKTIIPLMPTPWKPSYSSWKKRFEKLPVNDNTILIGHSCGGGFLIRWLDETKRKIKRLILVSPGKVGKARTKFRSDLYGNKIIKNLNKHVKDKIIIIFTSNDDIPTHIKAAYEYKNELPAKVIFLKNRGHYTLGDMGTEEFPEILKFIR